jgi:hypothetical protein
MYRQFSAGDDREGVSHSVIGVMDPRLENRYKSYLFLYLSSFYTRLLRRINVTSLVVTLMIACDGLVARSSL